MVVRGQSRSGDVFAGIVSTDQTPAKTCQSCTHVSAHTRIGSGRKPALAATFHRGAAGTDFKSCRGISIVRHVVKHRPLTSELSRLHKLE
jgi:hypothetical protein